MPLQVPLVDTFAPFREGLTNLRQAAIEAPQLQMNALKLAEGRRELQENAELRNLISQTPPEQRHQVAIKYLESKGRFQDAEQLRNFDLAKFQQLAQLDPQEAVKYFNQIHGTNFQYKPAPHYIVRPPGSGLLETTSGTELPPVAEKQSQEDKDFAEFKAIPGNEKKTRSQWKAETGAEAERARLNVQREIGPGPGQIGSEQKTAWDAYAFNLGLGDNAGQKLNPKQRQQAEAAQKKMFATVDPALQEQLARDRGEFYRMMAQYMPFRNVQTVIDPVTHLPTVVSAKTAVETGATPGKVSDVEKQASKAGVLNNLAFDIGEVKKYAPDLVANRGKIGVALGAPGGLTNDAIQGLAQSGMDQNTIKGLYAMKRLQESVFATKGLFGNTPLGSDIRARIMGEQVPGRSAILSGNAQSLITGLDEFSKAVKSVAKTQKSLLERFGQEIPPLFQEGTASAGPKVGDKKAGPDGVMRTRMSDGKWYTDEELRNAANR